VEEYLACLEAGRAPDRQAFLAAYPEIAAAVAECLDGLEFVRMAAPQLHQSASDGLAATLAAATATDPVAPLGDFRIVREVGRGGMGVVYEAEQLSLGRRIALKVLPFAAAMDPRHLQRFKNEAQAAAHLHHQHIVPVYCVGCERGVHYYAMQFIHGQTLAEVLHALRAQQGPEKEPAPPPTVTHPSQPAVGRLSPPEEPIGGDKAVTDTAPQAALTTEHAARSPAYYRSVATLVLQAAEALEHAHQQGVIQRDIKPANLLLDTRGHLWVTDFGLAQFQANPGLTMTGDVMGTLRYMSPEQAQGNRVVIDQRTDLYSLGVTLYELLTLEPPFDGQDRQKLLRQVTEEEPRPPRQRDKAISVDLETVVLKCLEKNPGDRYASAQELADDLRRFLEDKPIKAKRPTLGQRVRKWGLRHKSAVRALVACTVFAVLGLGISTALIWNARGRAETNYLSARGAVGHMLARVAAKQMGVVSPQEVRRQLLEDAVAFYTQLLAVNPRDAQAYLERGQVYRLLGKGDEQLADYEKAVELEPNKAYYRVFPAWYLHTRGQESAERALAHMQRARELEPDTLLYRAWLALIYAKLDQPGKARTELQRIGTLLVTQARGKPPKPGEGGGLDAEAHHIISMAERALGELDQAVGSARIATQMNPSIHRYQVNLVANLNDLGRHDEALAALDQAVAAASKPQEIVALLDYELPPNVLEMRSEIYLKQHREAAALEALNQVIDHADAYASTYRKRAVLQFHFEHYAEALADVARAVELNPDDVSNLTALPLQDVAYCPDTRVRDGVLALAETAIRAKSEAPDTYAGRAWMYSALGRFEKAKADAAKACALADQKPDALTYWRLAWAFGHSGLQDEEITCYRKFIERSPRAHGPHNNLGSALNNRGLRDQALACYRKAIELNPRGDPIPHNNLGCCLCEKGLWDQAVASFRRAIEVDPTYAGAYMNYARLLYRCPDPKIRDCTQAVTLAEKAVELAANDQEHWQAIWNTLAEAYDRVGDRKAAVAALEKSTARKYGGNRPGACARRAKLYAQFGEREKAKAELAKAIELVQRRPDADACNTLAWALVTNLDRKVRDPAQAVTLAKKAVELNPQNGNIWSTLGVAHYRAGEWKAAVSALEKSMSLRDGADCAACFFLAMAQWQLGDPSQARRSYDEAVTWMDKHNPIDDEVRGFRAEAANLMGIPCVLPTKEKDLVPGKK
jgi:tetratricopeptide (TPR) repeat protein